jgi:DNA repair exonuclease SbcCD ATPase subunit
MTFLLHRLRVQKFKQLTDVSLNFPERGTVLIEGANEAGKSTLFEAVYFALYGKALLDQQVLVDLKQYGADEMRVELEFSVSGRHFTVRRRLAANQTVQMDYTDADGAVCTIGGATAVRERMGDELRLSASALLNTCYVQQKDLGRLEGLNVTDRRDTINELLNLRVLTQMSDQFRIRHEDRALTDRLRQRVGIAELDAQWPEHRREQRATLLCWRYTQARNAEAEQNRLHAERQAALARQAEIADRQETIRADLKRCETLRTQLTAVEGELRLHIGAWEQAQTQRTQAAQRVTELQTLTDALPEREKHLRDWQAQAKRLARLENLEAQTIQLRSTQETLEAEAKQWKVRYQQWKDGAERLGKLTQKMADDQKALDEAETQCRDRQAANERLPRLALLLQHTREHAESGREAEQIGEELADAQNQADRLPSLRQTQNTLADILRRWKLRVEHDAQDIRLADALADLERKEREYKGIQQSVETLISQTAHLEDVAHTAREAETAVSAALQDAQRREALNAWAEAAERLAQADPAQATLQSLQAERAQLETQQQSAADELTRAERQTRLGMGGTAVSVAAGAALALANLAAGAILGVIAVVAALVWTAKNGRVRRTARETLEQARTAAAHLHGQIAATQNQASTHAAQMQTYAEREAECRRKIEQSGGAVPANAQEAHALTAALSPLSVLEAQAAYSKAHTARLDADSESQNAQRQIDTAHQQEHALREQNLPARRETLQAEQTVLLQSRAEDALLPALLRQERRENQNLPELEAAWRSAGDDVARAQTLAEKAESLREQQAGKIVQASNAFAQARALADELALTGQDIAHWKQQATDQSEQTRAAKTQTPDKTLTARQQDCREALMTAQESRTRLETGQAQTLDSLQSRTREAIQADQEQMANELAQNSHDQEPLLPVRALLTRAELPTTTLALHTRLTRIEENLHSDQQNALNLPQAQSDHDQKARALSLRRDELRTAWQTHLPRETEPATQEEAAERLPGICRRIQEQINAHDETGLRAEQRTLTQEDTTLTRLVAAKDQEHEQIEGQRRLYMADLNAAPTETLTDLVMRLPQLHRAEERDCAGWEAACNEAGQAADSNRIQRKTRTDALQIGDDLLDLEVERQQCMEAETGLEVKKRAGDIVNATRNSIVSRVMPLTMNNMRRLLPLLTEGRYHDVEWDENNNTLSVWDSQARAFQRKSVFSGGAKDQISLALRLAFALATLPGETGTRPGWLFLDEPLSSFDKTRTLALVELLTRGLLRSEFGQIFLVSHSEAFDPRLFQYRLRLEGGNIVESNLV